MCDRGNVPGPGFTGEAIGSYSDDEKQQGFFVKCNDDYSGPFKTLNEARTDARLKGKKLPIYHGILIRTADEVIDSNLFLVPKLKNE